MLGAFDFVYSKENYNRDFNYIDPLNNIKLFNKVLKNEHYSRVNMYNSQF